MCWGTVPCAGCKDQAGHSHFLVQPAGLWEPGKSWDTSPCWKSSMKHSVRIYGHDDAKDHSSCNYAKECEHVLPPLLQLEFTFD